MHIWVLTDGKAGDLQSCLGVAERLGAIWTADAGSVTIEQRVVDPKPPWLWLMPHGPVSPFAKRGSQDDPLRPPFPDVAIASGRRAVAYLRALKHRAPGCLTVFLKDPKTSRHGADLVWVPGHDRLRGDNVLVSALAPHRISPQLLAERRGHPPAHISNLPKPRLTVVLGGPARKTVYSQNDLAVFASALSQLADQAASLLVTGSRRTPEIWMEIIDKIMIGRPGLVWTPQKATPNPYLDFLSHADALVVTADSHNMVSEALATGVPVHVFAPEKLSPKLAAFVTSVFADNLAVPMGKTARHRLELTPQKPIDSSAIIAEEIRKRLKTRQAAPNAQ
uniref:mitochondrial fission ELM1 family protein n=1 Tax=Pararhizobium sp. IMCC3301 TaxID=3067904 RepID=UPI00274232F8|nr:mitochondrial fission ELM1 family protein [Pararhizobium sp. IMCC3301]